MHVTYAGHRYSKRCSLRIGMPVVEPPAPGPQVAAYLKSLPALPPAWTPPIEARRSEQKRLILGLSGPPQDVAQVDDVDAGGIPSRLYQPAGNEKAVFV